MNSLIELIDIIKLRPVMYLSKRYISCLKSFLDGWYFREPDKVADGYYMTAFQDWIAAKYGISSSQSWSDIILFYSQDEVDALENFFALFEQWKGTR